VIVSDTIRVVAAASRAWTSLALVAEEQHLAHAADHAAPDSCPALLHRGVEAVLRREAIADLRRRRLTPQIPQSPRSSASASSLYTALCAR
jgi:hypothetical protein